MAFSLTTEQVRLGQKTVTRRTGWADLEPGELFCAIEKGMGLKKGAKVRRLAVLRCVSNRPEGLWHMIERPEYGRAEARREGFPEMDGAAFIEFFCRTHRGCTSSSKPNRIEFEYVRFFS